MKKTKKIAMLFVAVVTTGLLLSGCQGKNENQAVNEGDSNQGLFLKIGAILPLTGDEAMFGEGAKKGMERAREVMKERYNMDIEVVYEDSQGSPSKGTTAYKKLKSYDNVDAVISMYSSVTTPISKLTEADKMPLLAIMASREDIVQGNEYAARLWITSKQQASTHFQSGLINPDKYKRIAILTTNDAFGTSMTEWFEKFVNDIEGMEVVWRGHNDINEKDFKSILLQIKSKEADAIIQAGTTADELIEILRDKKEIGWDVPVFESTDTALSNDNFRAEAGESAEGNYTSVIPYNLGAGSDEIEEIMNNVNMGDIPAWIGAYGYDSVNVFAQAALNDPNKENLAQAVRSLGTFESSNGTIEVGEDGELNFYFTSAVVKDGQLELAE
jgi:branched-chain amino acid transport system substrate-binding protein